MRATAAFRGPEKKSAFVYDNSHAAHWTIQAISDMCLSPPCASKKLFRSLPYFRILKYCLASFRTPYQVVHHVVDRMTRPLECHTFMLYHTTQGSLWIRETSRLPYNPLVKACIPVADPGHSAKAFGKVLYVDHLTKVSNGTLQLRLWCARLTIMYSYAAIKWNLKGFILRIRPAHLQLPKKSIAKLS
jgi:hypothetical protein